jgi:hypothetical protein
MAGELILHDLRRRPLVGAASGVLLHGQHMPLLLAGCSSGTGIVYTTSNQNNGCCNVWRWSICLCTQTQVVWTAAAALQLDAQPHSSPQVSRMWCSSYKINYKLIVEPRKCLQEGFHMPSLHASV